MNILSGFISELNKESLKVLSGEKAFKLYDTFGFPIELTEEILEDSGMTVDHNEFKKEMEAQRQRARNARAETSYMGSDEVPINKVNANLETEFVGYNNVKTAGKVLVLATDKEFVDELVEGTKDKS
jgi:alanyl-tRNA synthetase